MTVAELDWRTSPLAARVAPEGTATVVTLRGEADIVTLPALVGVLARVIAEHDRHVIVDLAQASFVDVSTLRALGRAAQLLACQDRTLTARGPSPMALRLLAFLGLTAVIQIGPSQHEQRHGARAVSPRWSLHKGDPCTSDSEPSC